ncbi:MAG TPA: hypothetical protein VNG95_01525, partial [Gemmatimonadales bacterium]|nr:hypothetical protein [Gemmatimonadales bacterium]
MNPKARQELVGIGALVVGLFLGLTFLPWHVTGGVGQSLGAMLWKLLGVGAVMIPILGIGWALAAFDRLGSLSSGRTAALGAGMIVLLPYAVAIVGRVDVAYLPADHALWSAPQTLVGIIPAFFAALVVHGLGTAGGVLVGLFAFSALGVFTVGWHPLVVLRQRDGENAKRGVRKAEVKNTVEETASPRERAVPLPTPHAVKKEREKDREPDKEKKPKPATKPVSVPEGVLLPPLTLLN